MAKCKRIIVVLALVVFCTPNTSHGATPAKPGAKCLKLGQTQTVTGKKYTCTKSGLKLVWNKGVTVKPKLEPYPSESSEPNKVVIEPTNPEPSSPSATPNLIKFKNCTEAKSAGVSPIMKDKNPELYNLNSGLDRDKDGVACDG